VQQNTLDICKVLKIIALHAIYFSWFIAFTQNKQDDLTIYSKTIDFGVKSFDADIAFIIVGQDRIKPFEIAVVIDELNYEFKEEHLLLKNIKNTQNKDFNKTLNWMVHDSTIQDSYKANTDILDALPDLDSSFINHPQINIDSLRSNRIEFKSMTAELLNTLLDNSTRSYARRWRKINRKFKHSIAFGLSKINYVGNFASLYYWLDCGKFGLCKSEHVIVFEKTNGEWQILNDILLWINL